MTRFVENVHSKSIHLVVYGHQVYFLGFYVVVEEAQGHELALYVVEADVDIGEGAFRSLPEVLVVEVLDRELLLAAITLVDFDQINFTLLHYYFISTFVATIYEIDLLFINFKQ